MTNKDGKQAEQVMMAIAIGLLVCGAVMIGSALRQSDVVLEVLQIAMAMFSFAMGIFLILIVLKVIKLD